MSGLGDRESPWILLHRWAGIGTRGVKVDGTRWVSVVESEGVTL